MAFWRLVIADRKEGFKNKAVEYSGFGLEIYLGFGRSLNPKP